MQNQLIAISAKQIRSSIVADIQEANDYAIICDEASDISLKEQLSLVIRFVDSVSTIREEFLTFLHCKEGTSGSSSLERIVTAWN